MVAPCVACAPDPPLPKSPSSSPPSYPSPPPPSPRSPHRPVSSPREAFRLLNSRWRAPHHLKQGHAHLLRRGLGHHPAVLTALLRRYAAHGGAHVRSAAAAFSGLPYPPPAFAWNVMIRALTLAGRPVDALCLFYNRMADAGVPPDKFTFPFAVKACSACGDLRKGKEVHARAIKAGLCDDIFLQNTLMHLYLRCEGGDGLSGHLVFARMRVRNMVSWTALISGLAARGDLEAARAVFEEMPVRRNVVTWTAMIDAYARNGWPEEALEMFRQMQVENIRPNAFTVVALLIACTELGSVKLGRWVHDYARKNGGLNDNVYVGTALIDMYSKCGSLKEARRVFDKMPAKSLATWNSMITGLGVHGHGQEAVDLFWEMEKAGLRPDDITFRGVLCACVRAGLTHEGFELFQCMRVQYGIVPTTEHYRCLVELLDRARVLDEMHMLVEKLRTGLRDDEIVEMLLKACKEYGVTGVELISKSIEGFEWSHGNGSHLLLQDQKRLEWEVG